MKILSIGTSSLRRFTRLCAPALSIAAVALVSASAMAAPADYNGGDVNNSNFSKANNWVGSLAPSDGDDLTFGTVTVPINRLSPNNNSYLTSVSSISFQDPTNLDPAQSFTLTGSAVTISGANLVRNFSSATQTISLGGTGLTLTGGTAIQTGSAAFNITSKIDTQGNHLLFQSFSGGEITVSGKISGVSGLGISIGQASGTPGSVTLSGNNNGLDDSITLVNGKLTIANNNALGNAPLIISGDAGDTRTLATDAARTISNDINATSDFSVAATDTLKVNGLTTLGDGTVVTATTTQGSGAVVFNGGIAGGGANGITLQGASPLFYYSITISGNTASTYTGTMNVAGGAFLDLNVNPANGAVTSDLSIDGLSQVQLDQNNQIADTATVTVNSGSEFNLNGHNETVEALAGGGTIQLGNGGQLTANSGTFSGYLTDTANGKLIHDGGGILVLSGTSDYHGNTVINNGTIASGATDSFSANSRFIVNQNGVLAIAGNNNTIANLDDNDGIGGLVDNGGGTDATLTFGDSTNSNFHGAIQNGSTGILGITKQGTGTFTLSGTNNTYTGATTVLDGTFKAGATNAFSAASDFTVNAPGTVTLAGFDQTIRSFSGDGTINLTGATLTMSGGSGSFGGTLTGNNNGSLYIDNGAELEVYGTSDYGGPTTINDGYIWATGTNALSANSRYVINSNGTLYLSDNETIGNLSGNGSIQGYYANAILTVGNSHNGTFDGVIEDGEGATVGLTKVGSGRLTLTATNTFSGPVTLEDGKLRVGTDSLGLGNVTVTGGDLAGIYNGGTPVQVNIGGSYTQTGGDLRVRIYSPFTNGNDTYVVMGSGVNLGSGSTLELTFPTGNGAVASGTTYELIHNAAGGVNGTFGDVTGLQNFALTQGQFATVVYVPTDIYLAIRNYLGTTPGLTPNQTEIARNLDSIAGIATSGNYGTVVNALYSLPPDQIGGALDQLSPEKFGNFASVTAFNNASFATQAMDSYLNGRRVGNHGTFVGNSGGIDSSGLVVNDPNYDPSLAMIHSRMMAWNAAPYSRSVISDSPSAELGGIDMKDSKNMKEMVGAAYDNPWSLFIAGNVVLAQGFSQTDVPHFGSNTESVTIGTDYRISKNFLAGVTLGYGHTDATLDNNGSNATVDSYSPGVYAAYANKGWYANFYGAYTHNAYTENRNIPLIGQMAHGTPQGNQGVVSLDGGYEFHSGALTYGPFLGLQYTHLTVGGYNETGSIADLNVQRDQADSMRTRLGGRVSYDFKCGGVAITPHLDASWQHEFMDQGRGITSAFNGFGAGSFTVYTPDPSRESALIDAGVTADLNQTVSVFVDYMAQAGQDNYFGQSVQAGVKIGF